MTCVHLRKIFQSLQDHQVKLQLSSCELVKVVCHECGEQEVCPSVLTELATDHGDQPETVIDVAGSEADYAETD